MLVSCNISGCRIQDGGSDLKYATNLTDVILENAPAGLKLPALVQRLSIKHHAANDMRYLHRCKPYDVWKELPALWSWL